MSIEKIQFIWYMRRMAWLALLGYLAGAALYVLQYRLFPQGGDMFEDFSNIQKAVIVAILVLLVALTAWGGWTAITMSRGKGSLGRARAVEFSSPIAAKRTVTTKTTPAKRLFDSFELVTLE